METFSLLVPALGIVFVAFVWGRSNAKKHKRDQFDRELRERGRK